MSRHVELTLSVETCRRLVVCKGFLALHPRLIAAIRIGAYEQDGVSVDVDPATAAWLQQAAKPRGRK